ncbi:MULTISPECIES: S1C family serine protease [Caproicibacterium]|uniref:Trypsin-like peptidase domain-containing protein n=1 Tax=Caproicibacterium argilliputei TaxID=3030016 RepID=A0AA97H116_9FIRM|nr:trypsin-like peptidase domain-containing protein [Caproicibacterium argilliputei]WOC32161.1 trypsin-like peptidase domain-containing protein [Caproicibacterium argilliputei]
MDEQNPRQANPTEQPAAGEPPQYQPEQWYPQEKPAFVPETDSRPVPREDGADGEAHYRNPAEPRVRKKMSRGIKTLVGVLLALLVVFTAMLIGISISDVQGNSAGGHLGTADEPSSGSSKATVSRSKDVIPNQGEKTGSVLTLQKKSGKALSPETVFTKVSPSVVGVLASVPTTGGGSGESQGTGIVASSDGVVLTNSHVIGNTSAATVTVVLSDKKQYDARILGYDKTSDLAVLKISATGLTPAAFGRAEELKVGEQVLAIGNPDGMNYSDSLTGGYVSALNRTIAGYSDNGMTYIQTDAAINPGNSGGPLCNLYGQVVGINSVKIITNGYEGMGFAIPMSQAVGIINQLIHNGYVQGRTRLGVTCRLLSTYEEAVLPVDGGVEILSIDNESSLKNSGVEKGDVLYQIDGKEISALNDITGVLSKHKPGDQVSAKIYSVKKRKTLRVKIKLLEDKGETQRVVSQEP